jgi:hypothetical protein
MAKAPRETEAAQGAEQARELDYQFRLLNRMFLVGCLAYWLVAAILLVTHVSPILALLFGALGTASFVALRRYFAGVRRRRLGPYLNPATGELTVPGGPKPVRWDALFRRPRS